MFIDGILSGNFPWYLLLQWHQLAVISLTYFCYDITDLLLLWYHWPTFAMIMISVVSVHAMNPLSVWCPTTKQLLWTCVDNRLPSTFQGCCLADQPERIPSNYVSTVWLNSAEIFYLEYFHAKAFFFLADHVWSLATIAWLTSCFQRLRSSAARTHCDVVNCVHCLMLSMYCFRGLPHLRLPSTYESLC